MGLFSGVSIKKPLGDAGKKTGIKIPSIKRIGQNIRAEAKRAGKGEVGKFVGGIGQSYYNVVTTVPRAIISKKPGEEILKGFSSGVNVAGFGIPGYLGQSKGAQNLLRSEGLSKYTLGLSENFAGFTRGVSEGSKTGVVRQDDWTNIFQGGLKVGAIAATAGAAATYFGAPAAPAAAVPESLAGMTISQPPILGPTAAELTAGAVTSTAPLGATAATAAAAPAATTAAAAASGTGIGTYLQYGAGAALLKSLIPGQVPLGNPAYMPSGDDSALWASSLNSAMNRSPYEAPGVVEAGLSPAILIAGIGVLGLFFLKKKGLI